MNRPNIAQMEQQIAAIDPAPWRASFDGDELYLYFHANLAARPIRVVISEDDPPSANEQAAAAFLVESREYVQALIAYVRQLEATAAE